MEERVARRKEEEKRKKEEERRRAAEEAAERRRVEERERAEEEEWLARIAKVQSIRGTNVVEMSEEVLEAPKKDKGKKRMRPVSNIWQSSDISNFII